MSTTVYITIGNSDDKLSQARWASFLGTINSSIILAKMDGAVVEFAGTSFPDSRWQNALWCVRCPDSTVVDALRTRLREHARRYLQDSIAWAEVDHVEMLEPAPAGPR